VSASNVKNRPYIPAVREAAIQQFRDKVGSDFRFAEVVAIIPALNEEECIAAVLEAMPAQACGRDVDILVIDDGSTDATAEVAAKYDHVYCSRLERNCGHGVALRVGYQLCEEFGAKIIATLDADMQWDPAELPTVLEPVAAGEADFAIGSRVLGTTEADDAVRNAGVAFFGWLFRTLTGAKLTDTSSGFRVFTTEVARTVPQVQVQYQTSEFLIGAVYAGFRITERPITMHKRLAGQSKKGGNIFYGTRYAWVILSTWGRERRRARREGRTVGR
jgi:glycosyltransferase involved in cell wall biosynthesis